MNQFRSLVFKITLSSVLILMVLQITYEILLRNLPAVAKVVKELVFDPENFSYIERVFVLSLEICILSFTLKSINSQSFSKAGLFSLGLFSCLTIILILSVFL